jgi:hypothetical protein
MKFWTENVKERDKSGCLAADRRITGWEDVEWIHLAQDRDQ